MRRAVIQSIDFHAVKRTSFLRMENIRIQSVTCPDRINTRFKDVIHNPMELGNGLIRGWASPLHGYLQFEKKRTDPGDHIHECWIRQS